MKEEAFSDVALSPEAVEGVRFRSHCFVSYCFASRFPAVYFSPDSRWERMGEGGCLLLRYVCFSIMGAVGLCCCCSFGSSSAPFPARGPTWIMKIKSNEYVGLATQQA